MATLDEVPLPPEKLTQKLPVFRDFALPNVYPGQRFQTRFRWNAVKQYFTFDFEWVNNGIVITRIPVQLRYPFKYQDHLRVIFLDPSRKTRRVRPSNLGDPVLMTVWPGPASPQFEALEDGSEPWEPIVEAGVGEPGYDAGIAPSSDSVYGTAVYDDSQYE